MGLTEKTLQQVQNGTTTDIQGAHTEPLVRYPSISTGWTSKTWGSSYTATADGWLKIHALCVSSQSWLLKVDSVEVIGGQAAGGGSITTRFLTIYPIKKGQNYQTFSSQWGAGAPSEKNIYFIPSLTE